MGDHDERKGTTAPKIPKSMCCGYDNNINLKVIRPTYETNYPTECLTLEEEKELL
jgi:hypothetical protein